MRRGSAPTVSRWNDRDVAAISRTAVETAPLGDLRSLAMMYRVCLAGALTSLALAVGGCSSTVLPIDAGVDRPATDSGPVDVASDTPATSPCPVAEPADGAPCSRANLECEYLADPRRECRHVATCASGVWRIDRPDTAGAEGRTWCASAPPTAACPATLAAAGGASCDAQGAVCSYGGALCECTSCVSFPVGTCSRPRVWLCDAVVAGCPTTSPRFGDVCAQDGLECNYGCNSPNGSVVCREGVWQRGSFSTCPISTRRAKRDILYLTPAEVDALAEQVRATRLATYEYTLPSMSGRRRLGFILEDQPESYAADPEQSQVDLYGFASLLAATVQSQDRQIRAMSRRIDSLERQLATRRR